MKPIPLRVQLRFVGAGYALVLATATLLVFQRYMQYVHHPEDVAASGGMYAGGDLLLEIFIGCMLLVPTVALALVIRNHETLYLRYSKILFGLSLTAPISLGLLSIPAVNQGTTLFGEVFLDRLFASPIVVTAFVMSRLLARFQSAKRFTSYAVVIEILTLIVMAAAILLSAKAHRG
jgi:hypothetical protein